MSNPDKSQKWNQKENKGDAMHNSNRGHPSNSRQTLPPSRPQNNCSFDVETLKSNIGNLSLERRPVQHPAGNESDLSDKQESPRLDKQSSFTSSNRLEISGFDDSNGLEISHLDDDESFVIDSFHSSTNSVPNRLPMGHHAPMGHAAVGQHGGMLHYGGAENYASPPRQPFNQIYHGVPMGQQDQGHPMYRFPPRATEHYHRNAVPQTPNYYHHAQENRHAVPYPNTFNQARNHQRTDFASPPFANQHSESNGMYSQQQQHLENGFRSMTPDIGFQESLTNIAPPAPVPSQRPDSAQQMYPDYGRQHSSPEYSRQVSGSECGIPDAKPEYSHQDSKESVGSDYSFTTIHPSFEDRSPLEQRMEDRNREQPCNPILTVSSQVSRNNTPGRTTSTQPYNSPAPTHQRPPPPPPQAPAERVKVFITYATEQANPHHTRTVVQISQTLLQNGFDVGVDVLEENLSSMSSSEWLDNSISRSDFVLICVSPGYRDVVEGQSTSGQSGYLQNEKAIHTQYIYRRIHAEYIRNGSKNFRFIPVLISGAELEHIPPWLRDTRVFEWPENYQDIIFRLFRKERFVKPKPGPAPRHTVERFSNYSERNNSRSSDQSDDHHPAEYRKAP